jgi:hypothetical protein
MKNLILSILFLLIISSLSAQDGYYYLTHYEMNDEFCDSKINSMVFDQTSNLFLASRKGVAVFDGTNWRQVKDIPTNVLVLKSDSAHHVIYAGMKNEFGVITQDKYGRYCYKALIERKENAGTYNQIVLNDDVVLFYSSKTIYSVNRTNNKDISLLKNEGNNEYSGIFVRRASKEVDGEIKKTGTVYVNEKGKGICKYENGNLSLIPDGSKFKDCKILFYTTFNAYNIIFGTDENKLFLFGKKGIQQFSKNTEVRSFLEENILKDGLDFSQKYFVLSTLTGGCVLIDKETGKINYYVNYMSGLPDDEINSIAIDRNNCLWISHDEGLSSMDADLKIRDYSSYPGIYGNVNDVILKGKNLYVASDNGI